MNFYETFMNLCESITFCSYFYESVSVYESVKNLCKYMKTLLNTIMEEILCDFFVDDEILWLKKYYNIVEVNVIWLKK